VLMLEMAFRSQHLPNEAAYILEDAKKGVNWLAMMSEQSVSARKAWEIFDSLIRLVAPKIRWSVFDMPTQAPIPPGYNWRRFSAPFSSPPPPPQPQQLSESNLQQFSAAPQPTEIATWQGPQSFGFQPSYTPAYEQASNPLDHSTAIERFSHIGQVHGHYDDPWQHIFTLSQPESSIGMEGTSHGDIMQGGMGEERRYLEPSTYGVDFGQY